MRCCTISRAKTFLKPRFGFISKSGNVERPIGKSDGRTRLEEFPKRCGTFLIDPPYFQVAVNFRNSRRGSASNEVQIMNDITGLAAVVMLFSIPLGGMAMYTYYRVNKLRTEERLAAISRGVNVPMQAELPPAARSRRAGILLVAAAVGYVITFSLIARVEPDAWVAASFGAIPFTLGLGFFLDSTLVRRDMHTS